MKQVGPDTSSKSSLNHFTVKGGVPFSVALNSTVESGMACWLSGFTKKLGGSAVFKKKTQFHQKCLRMKKISEASMETKFSVLTLRCIRVIG